MRAALVTGKHKLELVEMPTPEPQRGKAVVEIAYCGICGTDLHAYQSGDPYTPAICGHEWTGQVSALGEGVRDFREGDRVAIGVATACGNCATCRRGDTEHCEAVFAGMVGVDAMAPPHGGFAPSIALDAGRLYHVDRSISDRHAALLEPVTVAVHSVRRTGLRLGDSVVVLGAGPIGLLVLQCARIAGAGTTVLVEPQPVRRDLGGALGADHVLDPSAADNVGDAINDLLGTDGADIVFECAGIARTVEQAATYVRRGGVVSLVGVPMAPANIMALDWLVKELRVVTALGYLREEFDIAQGLVADGRIDCDPLLSETIGLDDMAAAFASLSSRPEQIKVLVDPRL